MASSFSLKSTSYDGRYLKLSCTQTRDIAKNTSTISWTLTSAGGNSNYYTTGPTTVYINGEEVYSKKRTDWTSYTFPAAKGSTSGTLTVTHDKYGDKSISVSLSTAIYTSKISTKSGTWDLDSIPRQATVTSAPNFNDEANPAITYSNPAGNAVTTLQACISLTGSKDDIAYRDIGKTDTSYTFNLTDAERKILRNACTTANSRTVYFYIKTVIGGVTLYSKLAKTLSIVNANPTFTSSQLSYADTNTAITEATNNPLMIVQNKSNLEVTYKAATAKKSATISKYTFTLNGVTKESTTAGGIVDFGKINSEKDLTLNVTVTDSRGNTASATKKITCYKYYSPSFIDFKAYRANKDGKIDSNGAYLKCEYATNIASVNGINARTVNIIGVGTEQVSASGNNILIDLNGDKDSTYKVYAEVNDLFGGTAKSEIGTVFGSSRIINISPDGTGVAIGKKSSGSERFESRWDAYFDNNLFIKNAQGDFNSLIDLIHPVGSVFITSENINPSTMLGGEWMLINKSFAPYAGENNNFFTAESNISKALCIVERNDSTVRVRLSCTLGYNVTDTSTLIGTLNWGKIGVNQITYALYQYPAGCDAGAAVILCEVGATKGEVHTVEAVGANGGNQTTNANMYLDFTVPVKHTDMIDSFCNKFYWKRTA